ncbi:MAG: right-handed parallel beta-helix repeat-containing protein [Planctomycetia bacterium]|nr:right-handed parallel beta-helix repeat-containing protein [Planctomycetia bacterium]
MSDVKLFGAKGDGQTDDTAAISHAIQRGDGVLSFPRGDYLISRPLYIPLDLHGRLSIDGHGGTARILMTGAGPALHLIGTHRRNALPANIADAVWDKQRLPTVQNIEIVGKHPEADGIRIDGVMQPTLHGVLIRRCRHGVHLLGNDRNVLIANCHIYDNSGVGVFLDRLNLHQINVTGCHISYGKQGGIKVVGCEIRNFQITGNDIEYNHDEKAETSADILFDCREGTVREGVITGNNIQAKTTPKGANVRFVGGGNRNSDVGLFAITGNLIGSQQTTIHLQQARGVSITGNSLYNGAHHSIWCEDSEHIVIGSNSIDHNPQYAGASTDRILLRRCTNVVLTGNIQEHIRPADGADEASVEIDGCVEVSLTGGHIVGSRRRGVWVRGSSVVRVADCTIRSQPGDKSFRAAIEVDEKSSRVMVLHNFAGKGSAGDVLLPKEAGVSAGNLEV